MSSEETPLNPLVATSAEHLFNAGRLGLHAHTAKFESPEQWLLDHVVGTGGDPIGYLYGGLTVSIGIRALLQRLGVDIRRLRRILDLGCGTARVIRWFGDLTPESELYGTDVNEQAVQWCADNVNFVRFVRNTALPPLPFPENTFDVIFAISVFTHLNEEYQIAWLSELQRVSKPGALILASIHGEDKAAGSIWADEYLQFLHQGFFFKAAREKTTVQNLPDYYQVAFHSKSYIERTWSQFFDIRAYVKHGPWYAQELAVLDKAKTHNCSSYPVFDFPIAAFDSPAAAAVVDEFYLEVSGWAFYPRRDSPRLWIWLDGIFVGSCSADIPRADVGAVFYSHQTAQSPGFYKRLSIKDLTKGEHLLWISVEDDWFPLCTTYFIVRFDPWARRYNRCAAWMRNLFLALQHGTAHLRTKLRLRTRLRRVFRSRR